MPERDGLPHNLAVWLGLAIATALFFLGIRVRRIVLALTQRDYARAQTVPQSQLQLIPS